MTAPTKLVDLHLRGMTDSAGAPGVEIATEAVEFWGDGTLRWVDDAGIERRLRVSGTILATLFEKVFGSNVTPLIGSASN